MVVLLRPDGLCVPCALPVHRWSSGVSLEVPVCPAVNVGTPQTLSKASEYCITTDGLLVFQSAAAPLYIKNVQTCPGRYKVSSALMS